GLPAHSLAWGLWAQTGAMTGELTEADLTRLSRSGVHALTATQGLDLFDAALATEEPLVALAAFNLPALRARAADDNLPAMLSGLVRVPARRGAAAQTAVVTAAPAQLAAGLIGLPADEQRSELMVLVRGTIAAVLGHADPDGIDPKSGLQKLGLDSLTAVELRNRLNAATGLRLPTTVAFDQPNAEALTEHLRTRILAEAAPGGDLPLAEEIDRITLALGGLRADDHAAVGTSLQALLRAWQDAELRHGSPVGEPEEADLDSVTDDELFAALDDELGL
ncbi:beta-ketoacyl reductase, partial [Kitasatospora sp. NPDC052868]|uniref:beta-ketoacyl reductase n=1 Tax=Kitasatospora sp. NPDC052868 TaxID=3364060 RepID=UPI0037C9799C